MAAIQFRTAQAVGEFVRLADMLPSGDHQERTEEIPADRTDRLQPDNVNREHTGVRFFFRGSPGEVQLFEAEVDAHHVVESHAHTEDEVIYVTKGELIFGSQVCPAGSAIFVPGKTLYGFRAGDEGARFLNFRPRADFTYITKENFLAARNTPAKQ